VWTDTETIEKPSTRIEDLPSLEPPDDDNLAHYVRGGHVHALCGVEVDPETSGEIADAKDCPACRDILTAWLEGRGWEGFSRPPGKARREELADLLGE
jgi:hypothetical protein